MVPGPQRVATGNWRASLSGAQASSSSRKATQLVAAAAAPTLRAAPTPGTAASITDTPSARAGRDAPGTTLFTTTTTSTSTPAWVRAEVTARWSRSGRPSRVGITAVTRGLPVPGLTGPRPPGAGSGSTTAQVVAPRPALPPSAAAEPSPAG